MSFILKTKTNTDGVVVVQRNQHHQLILRCRMLKKIIIIKQSSKMFSIMSRLPLVTQRCSKITLTQVKIFIFTNQKIFSILDIFFLQLNCLYDLHLSQCKTRTLTTTGKMFNTSGRDQPKVLKKTPITWKSVGHRSGWCRHIWHYDVSAGGKGKGSYEKKEESHRKSCNWWKI